MLFYEDSKSMLILLKFDSKGCHSNLHLMNELAQPFYIRSE